jgi:hypothetical protein
MSETGQFRQYADEALRGAVRSKTETERTTLLDLARTWLQAATASEPTPIGANCDPTGVGYSPTDHRTGR